MQLKIEQLENELKQKNPATIFLLYGEETYLLENSLKKIVKNFGETVKGINFINIYENTVNNLISDIQTPAFGYEKKLIIVRNSKLFVRGAKNKSKEKEQIIEKINNYIVNNYEEIIKTCILVFIEEDIEKNKLYNTVLKYGTVCDFQYLSYNQIISRLNAICKAYKVTISNNEIHYLLELCGTNMQDLINEIRKLIEYVGENGTIKKQDIDLLSTKNMQAVIFDLTDNLGKKEIKKSLEILDKLLYSKEPMQKIIITLYNHFKKLFITKIAIEENKNISESLRLKQNQLFLVNKYKTQSGYFYKSELRNIMQTLSNIESNYKQGKIDLDIGLRSTLCNYCSKN